jgi:hypothetical protein
VIGPGDRHTTLFDVNPVTGAIIEVFWADRTLETFSKGAGWFWQVRERGYAANGPAIGPFFSTYLAYRHALERRTNPPQFGRRILTTSGEC